MRYKFLLVGLSLFAGAFLASPAWAACDSGCVANAMAVGDRVAHETVLPELAQDGALGRLIRTEVGLEVCGLKGKSDAVSKLRDAQFEKVLGERVDKHPLGSEQDSEQQGNIKFASFLSTAKALAFGYALGYQEQTMAVTSGDAAAKKLTCQGYRKLADKVLFGDG